MKKIFALVLSLALVMSMSVTAFAATSITSNGGTDTAEVKGTYNAGGTAATIYKVDIAWEGLSFTFNAASQGTWDTTNHTYTGKTEAGWATGNGTITITNHSNAAITATPSYAADTGYEATKMIFKNGDTTLAENEGITVGSADNGQGTDGAGKEVTGTITVTPDGTLAETANGGKIGTITIKIS